MTRYGFFSSVYKKSSIDTLFDEIRFYKSIYSAIRYAKKRHYLAMFAYNDRKEWIEVWRRDGMS